MRTTAFNVVSDCCHSDIEMRRGTHYPLNDSYGESYKYQACCRCGESCLEVEACGTCGEVGCLDECELWR